MCKNTNTQDLRRKKEHYFRGRDHFKCIQIYTYSYFFISFSPSISNFIGCSFKNFIKLQNYKIIVHMDGEWKNVINQDITAFCFFFSYLSHLSSLSVSFFLSFCCADFKFYSISTLLLILSAFWVIDGMLDVGPSLQELSWHLQRRLSLADISLECGRGSPSRGQEWSRKCS